MYTITATNVNEAFPRGIHMLRTGGILQPSQHGNTLEMDQPCSIMYLNPRERILFDKDRASNPFLNLFEALWIIAGRNDVDFLQRLVGRMAGYSDDGITYYGAYGHRMRHAHTEKGLSPCDQIEEAIYRLTKNPDDRQVVLTIRRQDDMFYTGKDQPCNLLVSCKIRQGKLNIHVFNRSNDFIWGMTGTNVVQFSMLQEYLAGRIGVPVGTYHQTTDSMHVYVNEQWDKLKDKRPNGHSDPYNREETKPYDMMQNAEWWDADLHTFFERVDKSLNIYFSDFMTPFFQEVVSPLWLSFNEYEQYRTTKDVTHIMQALMAVDACAKCDWAYATQQWLQAFLEK